MKLSSHLRSLLLGVLAWHLSLGPGKATETVPLSALDLSKMTAGWGEPKIDRNIVGKEMSIAGRRFDRGVGTHAESVLHVQLDGRVERYTALVGVDVETLLDQALTMACNCEPCNCPVNGDNNGAWLGAVLGELAMAGRDKVTLVASPLLANFCDWIEQLIAESTGKEGMGILPVVGEPLASPNLYGDDRLFCSGYDTGPADGHGCRRIVGRGQERDGGGLGGYQGLSARPETRSNGSRTRPA